MLSLPRHAALRRPLSDVKGRRGELSWPDGRLVRACLRGSEDAWGALLEKYKNLIFSNWRRSRVRHRRRMNAIDPTASPRLWATS